MTINGFQIHDIKISKLENGPSYLTVLAEIRGGRFAATVEVYPPGDMRNAISDPFIDAQLRAIDSAVSISKQSDFQFPVRPGWSSSSKKVKDPNAPASVGQIKWLFGAAKNAGWSNVQVKALVKEKSGQDISKPELAKLTVGQVDAILQTLEQERPPSESVSQCASHVQKMQLHELRRALGWTQDAFQAWLNRKNTSWTELTASQAEKVITVLHEMLHKREVAA